MKHGIDNLIKTIEDYGKAIKKFNDDKQEITRTFQQAEAGQRIERLKAGMKATAEKLEGYFATQIDETIAAVEKDQATSKYISDPGFTNAIQILSSGGSRLELNVLKSLIAPYMDDHIAKKSIVAILNQQGRDPKRIGIDDGADALQILQGIKRDSSMTFRMWNGTNFPLTGSPSVIEHQLKRANQILEGGFDPLLEAETF
jgi:hypothetical protein